MTNENVLQIQNLKTYFFTRHGVVKAVDDVSFDLRKGECLCVVGESGCGKTATAMSILRLVDSPPGRIVGGEILFHGEDLLSCSESQLRQIRGNKIAMIFQDPQTALNPVFTVGDQIEEQIRLHLKTGSKADAGKGHFPDGAGGHSTGRRANQGISAPVFRRNEAKGHDCRSLSCDPEILIADEPTTALDTTIKVQILEIFRDLRAKTQMSIIFITHDLGTVAEIADRIIVMYGGAIVERGTVFDIFDQPAHPYTLGLINCLPNISARRDRLTPIPGTISNLINSPPGCIFYPRCDRHLPVCQEIKPQETLISGEHYISCHSPAPQKGR